MHIPTLGSRDAPASQPPLPISTAKLEARDAPLVSLVLKGTMLSILTLGIYRFWYKTNLRRYYWSNTRLLGDGFEYTGTGRELLIGFLIALAVFIPLYSAGSLAVWMLGPESLTGQIISSVVFALLVPALIQIALYRGRRYRLSRTRYRGVRFSQGGSGLQYLWQTVKWGFLSALTLGIALPFMRTALESYRMNNTAFGSAPCEFTATAGPLMKHWLVIWGSFVAGIGVLFVSLRGGGPGGFTVFLLMVLSFLLPAILWFYYRAAEFRHFTAGTRFGPITLHSDVTGGGIFKAFIIFGVIMLVMLLVLGGIGAGLMSGGPTPTTIVLSSVMGIGFILLSSVLAELFLRRRMWKLFASSITLSNLEALEDILNQAGPDAGAFGEAFDSGYDFAS